MYLLTQRMFVEARSGSLFQEYVKDYYDDNENYDGQAARVDDPIFQAEQEWRAMFEDDTEVSYNV